MPSASSVSLIASSDRTGAAPSRPRAVSARAAKAAPRTLGLPSGAGGPGLESGVLAEIDDAAAQGIARSLQPVLARASAPVAGGAHATLLRLLA